MGKPVLNLADEIEFRYQASYDYTYISVGTIDPSGTVNKKLIQESEEKLVEGKIKRVRADKDNGIMTNEKGIDNFPWPKPEILNFSPFIYASKYLKLGMKVIAILGKIFTADWKLLSFTHFCKQVYVNQQFIQKLINRIGSIQLEVLKK